jgi:diguanylate cyclase (GGDEF)-like protein
MPDRNIAWAIRLGVLVTLLVLMCVVTPVYLWIQAYGSISGPAAMAFATILPLIICPTLSFIMLRTRLRIYRLAEQNYKIAHKDELTGLPNRRAFFEAARQLQTRAHFVGRPFFCAIADIDNFKRVNDSHGHDVGDHVLREIAVRLNAKVPEDCLVARLGGEEFSIAGMFSSEVVAYRALGRLVRDVAAEPIQTPIGELTVTISLGYCKDHYSREISTLLSRADKGLYAAKRFGKNRAMSFDHPDSDPEMFAA